MKLLRYGPRGAEKPGLVDGDGQVRDLSAHVGDVMHLGIDKLGAQRQQVVAWRHLGDTVLP